MELRDYLNVISARRGTIVLATLVVSLVALAASLVQSPIFEAESRVLISEKDTGAAIFGTVLPELSSQPERALQTQVQLVEVRPVAEATIRRLNLKQTAEQVLEVVTVSAVGQTNLISIKARASSPKLAADVANVMAEEYVKASRDRKRASIQDAAEEVEDRLDRVREEILAAVDTGTSDSAEAERDIAVGTYTTLAEKLEELRINEQLETGSGTIVQSAVLQPTPVAPEPVRNAGLGLLVGLLFGTAMAFLLEYLDSTIKSTEEAEKVFGAPVLGVVPLERYERGVARQLTILDAPGSAAAEAYRVLRNSIDFVNFEHNLKTVLVTSATPAEGKSTLSANLAASLTQAGKKVVLISCDFRRPTTDQFFNVDNTVGLSEVLLGTHTLKSALQQPVDDRLLILTAGKMPPNPSELLASNRMKEVIESLEEWADWVIIDTPPILAVADPVSVARWVDGVLMVSKAGESTREAALKAVELLGKVGAKVIGVAIWGLDESKNRPGYGYGYGYYTGGYHYYRSYYGVGAQHGGSKSKSSSTQAPGALSRAVSHWIARILTGLLGFLAVIAVALAAAYLMDEYFGYQLTDFLSRWVRLW